MSDASAFDTKTVSTTRRNNFNFLRVVLAILVIWSHSYPLLFGSHTLDPLQRILRKQYDLPNDHAIDTGHLAVCGFFVISGYLVTMSWQRSHGFYDYMKKRILRIYPGYIATVLFCFLIVGPISAPSIHGYNAGLVPLAKRNVVGLVTLGLPVVPPVFVGSPYPNAIDGSLWTIRFEFGCYLMVTILGSLAYFCRRFLPRKVIRTLPVCFFVVVLGIYSANCPGQVGGRLAGHHFVLDGLAKFLRLFVYFVSGMCFYLYRDKVRYSRSIFLLSLGALAASVYILPVLPYTLPIFGAYALLYVAFLKGPLNQFGRNTDISYGLYLYAFPIQQLLVQHYGSRLSTLTLFVSALLVTCCFAFLSWFLIEKPCLQFKKRSKFPAAASPQAVS